MDSTQETPPAPVHATHAPLDPIRAMTDGWNTFKANLWTCIGVTLVLMAIFVVGQLIPFVNVLFLLLVAPAVAAGGAGYFLRGSRGERASFESAFEGFQRWASATGALVIVSLVSMLILLPVLLAMFGAAGLAAIVERQPGASPNFQPAGFGLLWLAMLVIYPLMLWWSLRSAMTIFVLMEPERPGAIESIRRSFALTAGRFWRIVGFTLLTVPVMLIGVLALCVGVIPAATVTYYGWAHLYRQLRERT
ncbi:MAG: hypothetical protein IT347_12315 [Candidatus Eisenbacteria bacterium]|nr:hypothetical protein [Candidatus Eisenbacteria bacterium]